MGHEIEYLNQELLKKRTYSQTELGLESHSCIVSEQLYSFYSAYRLRTLCIQLTTIFQKQFCLTINTCHLEYIPEAHVHIDGVHGKGDGVEIGIKDVVKAVS